MTEIESWESKCCRCEGEPKSDVHPGKRACHVACGSCLYPGDWSRCQSCEIVTHCMYAVEYLRNMKMRSSEKGCIFKDQLSGEESLYHALNFVNAQQQLLNTHGAKRYIKELREENAESRCLKR